jgi:REP element-mobilizing transposase RayT
LVGKWQRDCWDTQMRNAAHYLRKLDYVRNNPVRAGLAVRPEDWPYAGTVTPLPWLTG